MPDSSRDNSNLSKESRFPAGFACSRHGSEAGSDNFGLARRVQELARDAVEYVVLKGFAIRLPDSWSEVLAPDSVAAPSKAGRAAPGGGDEGGGDEGVEAFGLPFFFDPFFFWTKAGWPDLGFIFSVKNQGKLTKNGVDRG